MQIPKEVLRRNPLVQFGITEGRQEGRREGRKLGEVELVLRLVKRRLRALTAEQEEAIRRLRLRRVEALGEALLDFRSAADLDRWLRLHSH